MDLARGYDMPGWGLTETDQRLGRDLNGGGRRQRSGTKLLGTLLVNEQISQPLQPIALVINIAKAKTTSAAKPIEMPEEQ